MTDQEWIYKPLAALQKHPRNYRIGDIDLIVNSITRFGFNGDLRIRNDLILAGNQSYTALVRMKAEGKPAPRRIRVDGDEWLVPCIDLSHLTESESLAYLVADNRTQASGKEDDAALLSILQEVKQIDSSAFAATGFDDKAVNLLISSERRKAKQNEDIDPATLQSRSDEFGKKWATAPGQLWYIGKHRLYIGDSTNSEHVQALLQGATPAIMVTDPPYGVDYDAEWRLRLNESPRAIGQVTNDTRSNWRPAYTLAGADVAYVWHASLHTDSVLNDLRACDYEPRTQIIWVKDNFAVSRGHYHWQHEPCWYCVKKGATAKWLGDRKQVTLWEERYTHQ